MDLHPPNPACNRGRSSSWPSRICLSPLLIFLVLHVSRPRVCETQGTNPKNQGRGEGGLGVFEVFQLNEESFISISRMNLSDIPYPSAYPIHPYREYIVQ